MGIFVLLVVMLLAGVVMGSMMGTPKTPDTTQDFEVPDTRIGTPIGVLFGTRMLRSPNIVWYGDVKILKVKVDMMGKK